MYLLRTCRNDYEKWWLRTVLAYYYLLLAYLLLSFEVFVSFVSNIYDVFTVSSCVRLLLKFCDGFFSHQLFIVKITSLSDFKLFLGKSLLLTVRWQWSAITFCCSSTGL